MIEILDYFLPILGVIIFLILDDRWKKKYDLPLKKHIIIVIGKVITLVFSMLLLLFIFGYMLKASEVQLLPIMVIGIGCSCALVSYLFQPFYLKK